MTRYVLRRALGTLPLLLAIAVVTFGISVAMEGRRSIAGQVCGQGATPECIATIEAQIGLDQPVHARFVDWLTGVLRGDLGTSLANDTIQVSSLIGERIWPTLSIVAFGIVVGVAIGIALGVVAALRPGGRVDRSISMVAAGVIAAPGFVIGMLLSWWLAVRWGWFEPVGYTPLGESVTGWLKSITLPGTALALPTIAVVQRQLRSSMANALQSRYVLAARARGVRARSLISGHALPNAMIPTVTVIGFRAAAAIGLTVAVELVFNIRGMGDLLVSAIVNRNVTVLQGGMLAVGLVVAAVNLVVDVTYGVLNPKVRLT